jgi:DNA-binding FadR family transcriptional regulator
MTNTTALPTTEFRAKQVYEQVADKIRESIDNGHFPVGTRLPAERVLASRFGVSRPAVREAIGALQNEGRVFTKQGSGTYVNALPDTSAAATAQSNTGNLPPDADLSPLATLEVRLLLEPTIARLAARQHRHDPLAEQYLAMMTSVHDISDPQQQALWHESDRLFHRQLAAMTCNPLIIKIADEISKSMDQPLWQRLRDDGIYDPGRIQLYVAEHQLIYEAIINGDADAAAFYVEGHIKRVRKDIATR